MKAFLKDPKNTALKGTITLLVASGAKLFVVNKSGERSLMLARLARNKELESLLLKKP